MKKLTISAALTVVAPAVGLASAAATEPVASTLPGPTGPYPVGPTGLHLVDHDRTDPWTSRPRELMASLWYPAAVNGSRARHLRRPWPHYDRNAGVPPGTADFAGTVTHSRTRATPLPGRRPVVLYSPGGGHSRFLGTTLVEDLASRGYVVVGIDHTPVGPVQFPDRVALPRSSVAVGDRLERPSSPARKRRTNSRSPSVTGPPQAADLSTTTIPRQELQRTTLMRKAVAHRWWTQSLGTYHRTSPAASPRPRGRAGAGRLHRLADGSQST
ncbi:hypothetical protein [Saccharothrix sp.]|uniref:hypothetical protein n=1 Tax=Saccharothrix sp. TaxID=1873460 RepID=UPI00281251CF|nr:hypothetical protein [Saccharothrix sp.]